MRTCQILAFLLLGVATVLSAIGKAWPAAFIAAALAIELIPAVFELTT